MGSWTGALLCNYQGLQEKTEALTPNILSSKNFICLFGFPCFGSTQDWKLISHARGLLWLIPNLVNTRNRNTYKSAKQVGKSSSIHLLNCFLIPSVLKWQCFLIIKDQSLTTETTTQWQNHLRWLCFPEWKYEWETLKQHPREDQAQRN